MMNSNNEEDTTRSRLFGKGNIELFGESRRAFLQQGALILTGSAMIGLPWREVRADAGGNDKHQLRIGLLTDCHYADKKPAGTRYYRKSLSKLNEAVAEFTRSHATFAVEMGDFIDSAEDIEAEIGYLETIDREFAKFKGDRHYVLGNHCVFTLTKKEFIENCGAKQPHYSFNEKGFHFVVLDACYREDGVGYERQNFKWTDANIPTDQVKWLEADLNATDKKTVVFVHQRLDTSDQHGIKNAEAVRSILEKSGNVLAVFQGHSHQNDHREIGGIHYCTLRAVVEKSGLENNGYAIVDLYSDGSIRVDGFQRQKDYEWPQQ